MPKTGTPELTKKEAITFVQMRDMGCFGYGDDQEITHPADLFPGPMRAPYRNAVLSMRKKFPGARVLGTTRHNETFATGYYETRGIDVAAARAAYERYCQAHPDWDHSQAYDSDRV